MFGFIFNQYHGYLEGVCRGMKNELLTATDYSNLTSCKTLEDLKLNLEETCYSSFLNNDSDQIVVAKLEEGLKNKLVQDFQYLQKQATGQLSQFLDFMTHSYMIDNVMLLITGTFYKRPISELIPKCHPLGSFKELKAIHVASTPAELYNAILIDTPLAPYFKSCINEQDLDEMHIEVLRNTVYKSYLEEFVKFCKSIGGETKNEMCDILGFEADRRAFMITINSMGTELTKDDRENLYPTCGKLNSMGLKALANAEEFSQVADVANYYPDYKFCFDNSGIDVGHKPLEDRFFEYEVKLHLHSFMKQFHFGLFYSLLKLREQEYRNIVWIAECIAQQYKIKIDNYIAII